MIFQFKYLQYHTKYMTDEDIVQCNPLTITQLRKQLKAQSATIHFHYISDMSILEEVEDEVLTKITTIEIEASTVRDVHLLTKFSTLQELKIIDCGIQQTSELIGLEQIKVKKLSFPLNKISDVQSLEKQLYIEEISFSLNKIKKLKGFGFGFFDLVWVTKMNLSKNNIEEIPDSIAMMQGLTELDLQLNKLKEMKNIGLLTNIQKLFLGGNQFKDLNEISHLSPLNNLQSLYLKLTLDLEGYESPFVEQNDYENVIKRYLSIHQDLDGVDFQCTRQQLFTTQNFAETLQSYADLYRSAKLAVDRQRGSSQQGKQMSARLKKRRLRPATEQQPQREDVKQIIEQQPAEVKPNSGNEKSRFQTPRQPVKFAIKERPIESSSEEVQVHEQPKKKVELARQYSITLDTMMEDSEDEAAKANLQVQKQEKVKQVESEFNMMDKEASMKLHELEKLLGQENPQNQKQIQENKQQNVNQISKQKENQNQVKDNKKDQPQNQNANQNQNQKDNIKEVKEDKKDESKNANQKQNANQAQENKKDQQQDVKQNNQNQKKEPQMQKDQPPKKEAQNKPPVKETEAKTIQLLQANIAQTVQKKAVAESVDLVLMDEVKPKLDQSEVPAVKPKPVTDCRINVEQVAKELQKELINVKQDVQELRILQNHHISKLKAVIGYLNRIMKQK